MAGETVQMQMIRRYARLLREAQAEYRGPRVGARERRVPRDLRRERETVASQTPAREKA